MAEQSITINGVETTLTATGFATWTASDISLRLRPDAITWNATRGELSAKGTSAQTATDNLLAAERKAAKAAQLTARSTTGQIFAREMRAYLHIGPRTRRFNSKKWDSDGHRDVMQAIADANNFPGASDAKRQAIFQTAFAALCSWEKHIDGYRADAVLVSHINLMTPHQFVGLIADMIDAEITNVGEGERFFADMAHRFHTRAA